ncbi:YqaE/Pmp3 family membrane protein [Oceanobacillus neutriphilus]|uniref:YqaE/Pmp3 family membrane protein n=1 Tax=Oceanobacillus neutriphilus TaxID=531815 RepID=A0ABQ2P285_9BACI|nr:YqaE/Pmp3 family membrane protein [Oceanobacillus neutriphilus]GGP16454.1 hypothetical protein GCM10011346_48480 [Oceanobacillus neutriphilus]
MRFWAILCPPIAVIMTGRPFQALIALVLWLCLWIPGSIYAWGIVTDHKADKRMEKQVKLQHKLSEKAEREKQA